MVAKTTIKTTSKPCAWIVSPNDKGRKSIKNGNVYLKDGDEFEIELFNPLQDCVLADIKLNGQSISKSGLVLKPGQRFYLDCFIDDRKKFIFNTYNIESSIEAIEATAKNGLLEVFFYKESIITLDNWKDKFKQVIVEKWYPYYPATIIGNNPYPWNNIYYGSLTTNNATFGSCTTNTANYSDQSSIVNCSSSYSSSVDLSDLINTKSFSDMTTPINSTIETGRVEMGTVSTQKFNEIDMEFETYYIASTIINILPDSRKPIYTKDIKSTTTIKSSPELTSVVIKDGVKNDSDNIIELIKKLAELHKAGILTDDEFSSKKIELLSKI